MGTSGTRSERPGHPERGAAARPRRLVVVGAVVAALVLTLLGSGSAPAVSNYRVDTRHDLGAGVTWLTYRADGPQLFMQVAHLGAGADVDLVPVVSNDQVFENPPAARTERTTSMCNRAGGLVCVNADFPVCQSCGEPFGAVIRDRRPVRSPNPHHEQVSVLDGGLSTAALTFDMALVATVPPAPPADDGPLGDVLDGEEEPPDPTTFSLVIDEVNRSSPGNLTLYTPLWAHTTQTGGAEGGVVARGPIPQIGASADSDLVRRVSGDVTIPRDGYVISGTGKAAERLTEFLDRVRDERASRVDLRARASIPALESIGGHPVILRDGKRVPQNLDDGKIRNRHPRTLIGWNAAGERWIVAVDGRRPGHSAGVTIAEAADVLEHLGATEAVNLDGGGSTTFVTASPCRNGTRPCIRNLPSDGRERPVSSALAVVPRDPDVLVAARATAPITPVTAPPPPPIIEPSDPPPPPPEPAPAPPPSPPTTTPTPVTEPSTTTTTTAPTTTTVSRPGPDLSELANPGDESAGGPTHPADDPPLGVILLAVGMLAVAGTMLRKAVVVGRIGR